MQPQMQKQQPAQAAPSGPPDRGKTHYYMCIADEHERRAAQAWLDKHFKTDPRLVTELKIDRLYDDSTVSVLVRRPGRKGNPKMSVPLVADAQGIKETAPREDDDLAEEIEERKVIVCRDYWSDAGTEDREGELTVSRFLEELGKTSIPATIKYRDDQRILRFGWA
jgi:hypothetical protein